MNLENLYLRFLNFLHRPLMRRGLKDPYHEIFEQFLTLTAETPLPSILEIGSRNVTGVTRRSLFPNCDDYCGFDVLAGPGVDIVGDAHKLSGYFPAERFDFVFSVSVFEHLLFPWKAVMEINSALKIGGHVFLSTHPVWPAHELPWDFWRFPANGLYGLFNEYTGFEIIALSEGLPCRTYSLVEDPPTRELPLHPMNQGVALIARKTSNYRSDLLKWDLVVDDVLDSIYPSSETSS